MTEAGESQRQFGERVGLAPSRINQLVKEGLPILSNGRIDTEAALEWMDQNLDRERRARAKQGSKGSVTGAANASRAASPSTPTPSVSGALPPAAPIAAAGAPMAEVRRQHEIVKVALARLRLETEKGRLVNRDEIKVAIFNRARRERNAHLAWGLRVAPQMAAELAVDPALMFTCLDRYLREHLADLAKTPLLDLPE
ncbi:MarR family transcriptional regulator [Azospirillaceae bacterium]